MDLILKQFSLFSFVINFSRFEVSTKFFVFFSLSWHFTLYLQMLTLCYELSEFPLDTFFSLITLIKVYNSFDIPCKEL